MSQCKWNISNRDHVNYTGEGQILDGAVMETLSAMSTIFFFRAAACCSMRVQRLSERVAFLRLRHPEQEQELIAVNQMLKALSL